MGIQLSLFGNNLENDFQSLMRMIPAAEADYATHGMHPYPAKFLPHYPSIFIRHFSDEEDLVLDPMCGSGTTLIEACLQNRRAYGIDIDPIGALIAKVSITPLPETLLRDFEADVVATVEARMRSGATTCVEMPSEQDYPNAALWFRDDVLRELLVIRNTILDCSHRDDLRDFGLLCLSAITKPVSNADPRDIFPERDQKNLVRAREDVVGLFRRSVHEMRLQLSAFSMRVRGEYRGKVHQGDARGIDLPDGVVKLVFTSPPYTYAMDYARVHKLSTLLFVMTNQELREYRRRYVGTDRVSVNDPILSFEGFEFAADEIRAVHSERPKLGVILYRYFSDLYTITQECTRVLQPGGHLIYVIGNSTVRGAHFRTDDVLAGICESTGLSVMSRMSRPYYAYRMSRKRNVQSNTIKADTFLIAQKA